MQVNWTEEVMKRKDQFLQDLKGLIQIKSVLDEVNATSEAPLGQGVKDALVYLLNLGKEAGFEIKNLDNLAGHIEYGEGNELIGVLCHVDVVPEGDGWSVDPFGAEIKDGKMFGRGSIDDKGPTMAAFYALKIVKELGHPLSKKVRLIAGTDEESDWRCVEHYFKHEEMPQMGFAPDADFPIIHAEKGIASLDLHYKGLNEESEQPFKVLKFEAGRRYNMVPDFATVTLQYKDSHDLISEAFSDFLLKQGLTGQVEAGEDQLTLSLNGVSAHAMEPEHGKNAALYLGAFLAEQPIDKKSEPFFTFIRDFLFADTRGRNIKVAYQDEISGDLTVNAAIFSYTSESGGKISLNFRYPVTFNMEDGKNKIEEVVSRVGFSLGNFTNSKPHHVEKNHPLIKTLQKVYEEQTGEEANLLAIGGGTYARSLTAGVAFGPIFPGKPDVAHQKDEYVEIDDLLKACAIYAQAIYELAK